MQQIFLNENCISDNVCHITGEDYKHLAKVVRIRTGEKIRVTSSSEESYICEVTEVGQDEILAEIKEEAFSTELPNKIYLFQAIPKGTRFETVIEKTVELGVYEIIPVEMKNCVVRWEDAKKKKKVERLQKIEDEILADIRNKDYEQALLKAQTLYYTDSWSNSAKEGWDNKRNALIKQLNELLGREETTDAEAD